MGLGGGACFFCASCQPRSVRAVFEDFGERVGRHVVVIFDVVGGHEVNHVGCRPIDVSIGRVHGGVGEIVVDVVLGGGHVDFHDVHFVCPFFAKNLCGLLDVSKRHAAHPRCRKPCHTLSSRIPGPCDTRSRDHGQSPPCGAANHAGTPR